MKPLTAILFAALLLTAQTSFSDHEKLGKTLAAENKWAEARKEFHAALGEASTEIQNAIAAYRIAQTYRAEGNTASALDWYHQSLRYHASHQAEDEMMQMELERVNKQTSAAEIKQDLLRPSSQKSPSAEPNNFIDLDILFATDQYTLLADGRKQVHELAVAMTSDDFKASSFRITGNTDLTGSADHNMTLSIARAKTVRDALLAETHISADRIKWDGKGMTNPKYSEDVADPGHLANARRLNRRVQVTLLE